MKRSTSLTVGSFGATRYLRVVWLFIWAFWAVGGGSGCSQSEPLIVPAEQGNPPAVGGGDDHRRGTLWRDVSRANQVEARQCFEQQCCYDEFCWRCGCGDGITTGGGTGGGHDDQGPCYLCGDAGMCYGGYWYGATSCSCKNDL